MKQFVQKNSEKVLCESFQSKIFVSTKHLLLILQNPPKNTTEELFFNRLEIGYGTAVSDVPFYEDCVCAKQMVYLKLYNDYWTHHEDKQLREIRMDK